MDYGLFILPMKAVSKRAYKCRLYYMRSTVIVIVSHALDHSDTSEDTCKFMKWGPGTIKAGCIKISHSKNWESCDRFTPSTSSRVTKDF